MILKLLITLIFVGTSLLKLSGKVAPDWNRWGYPRQFMLCDRHRRAFRACSLLVAGTRNPRCRGPWFRSARRACNLGQVP